MFSVQQATFTQVATNKKKKEEEEEAPTSLELPPRPPGDYLDIDYIFGMSTRGGFPQERFVWHQKNRFFVTHVNNFLTVNYLTESRS